MFLNFMGLDISTKTGICIIQVIFETGKYKILHISEITAHSNNIYFGKLLRAGDIAMQVAEMCEEYDVHFALIEGFAYANHYTLSMLTEITTLIKYKLRLLHVPYLIIAPTSLKKFITGNGRATKLQMEKICRLKYSLEYKHSLTSDTKVLTDNMVDAFSLAMVLHEVYTKKIDVNDITYETISHLLEVGYVGVY